ncbi:ATP-grasp domain-containing protein [Actinopolyspora xinjiangensis]|uniref:ATP-grasp domain-containing protein n=1 Tax=Actinopolyspora xinjiangensis TaxID=405564 RepID=A0A1H0X398_9ACTN|nr:ATP-grasp domain-containing protein [Actinopolyspora xinjiangensis]SDP96936.1 ATP-grasp domain-containing protein [Actinopolyspora xinjiangensis]
MGETSQALKDDDLAILVVGKGYSAYRGYALEELRDAGVRVYLCDDEELEPGEANLIERMLYVDFERPPEQEAERLADQIADTQFDRSLCYIESLLSWTAEFSQFLGIAFSDPERMRAVRSKYLMRRAFADAGLATPNNQVGEPAELLATDLTFPLIIKPEQGHSSIGVEMIGSHEQLTEYFGRDNNAKADRYVVEQVVRGVEYSVEGYTHDGKTVATGLTTKFKTEPPFFEELGQFCARGVDVTEAQRELFTAAVRAVGLDSSIFHFEFMADNASLTPIELGARMGGDKIPYLHRRATGRSLLLEYLGRPVSYPRTSDPGVGIVFFVPREPGMVPEAFPPAELRAELGESFIECGPGKVVLTTPDDFFVRLGFAVLTAPTAEEFVARANAKVEMFEQAVGIGLHRLRFDSLDTSAGFGPVSAHV